MRGLLREIHFAMGSPEFNKGFEIFFLSTKKEMGCSFPMVSRHGFAATS
jgi:hypothetical protein